MNHSQATRSVASSSSTVSKIKNPALRSRARKAIGRAINTLLEPLEERRMLAAGALDTTFGAGGKVLTDFNLAGGQDDAFAIQPLPDGGAAVAGSFSSAFGIARYAPNGSLAWTNRTPISGLSVANAMVLQGDKFIL